MLSIKRPLPAILLVVLAILTPICFAQDTWKPTFGVGIGGVQVNAVDKGSVAANAHLKTGDRITLWNGQPVIDIATIRELLSDAGAGSAANIEIMRAGEGEGEHFIMQLSLQFPKTFDEGGSASLGVTPAYGVCVTNILPDSVAASCGLRSGDVILSWNGQDADSFATLKTLVSRCRPGSKIGLGVLRNGEQLSLNARFPGGAVDIVEEGPAKSEKSNRRSIARSSTGFGGSPFGGMEAIAELSDVSEQLARTIKRLHSTDSRGEQWQRAMKNLEEINARIAEMAKGIEGMKRMFEGFSSGGFRGGDVGELEGGEMPDVPFMKEMEERLHELLGEGVDPEEISEIISNEFPGVQIEIRSGSPEEMEEAEESVEEPTVDETDTHRRAMEARERAAKEQAQEEAAQEAAERAKKHQKRMNDVRQNLSEYRAQLKEHQEKLKALRSKVAGAEGDERTGLKKAMADLRAATKNIRKRVARLNKSLKEPKNK